MRFPFALRSTVDSLEEELSLQSNVATSRYHVQKAEIIRLRGALKKIADGQTDYANATVKRLCKIARDALQDRR